MSEGSEAILRKTPLFASLTEHEMHALATRVSKKHFQRGELLFGEGDSCMGLFLAATGKIRIFKLSPSGREQVLAVEGPGSSFAELPVFDGGNYPAAASAVEDAEVLFISRKDFRTSAGSIPMLL
jgi:CRP-like cAMP-binding protein